MAEGKRDWKFIVASVIGIIGVVAALVPWLSDQLGSKSLQLRIVSVTPLRSEAASDITGLSITLKGQELVDPYVSVLELLNNGSKPISKSDFEEPIEITVKTPTPFTVANARVTPVNPPDLNPKLAFVPAIEVMRLDPLLLNPTDQLRFSFMSPGGKPTFTVKSRILGVNKIELIDTTVTSARLRKLWAQAVIGFWLISSGYYLAMHAFFSWRYGSRFEWELLLISVIAIVASPWLMSPLTTEHYKLHWLWDSLMTVLACLIALPTLLRLRGRLIGIRSPLRP